MSDDPPEKPDDIEHDDVRSGEPSDQSDPNKEPDDVSEPATEHESEPGPEPGEETDSDDPLDRGIQNETKTGADPEPAGRPRTASEASSDTAPGSGDPNRWGEPDERGSGIKSGLYRRLAVGVGIVLAILVVSAIAGIIFTPEPPSQSVGDAPEPSEPPTAFAAENVAVDRIEATGDVNVSDDLTVAGGHSEQTILIEDTGSFEQREVRPLVRGATEAGHDIQFREGGDLESDLDDADAYVLIAPRGGFADDEVEAITEFTDEGGRLIMLAEPDRVQIDLLAGIQTVQTDMRTVASEYGIVFGNRYLFDTAENDANHRQIFGEPTGETDLGVPELELDRTVLSTATRVNSHEGAVLLRTPESTKLSDGGSTDAYPVAVAQNNVLAVGDSEFLAEENHNVADNEEFVEYIIEFALDG